MAVGSDVARGQLELLDGMTCPHRWCDGVLGRDGPAVSCGRCGRLIVRFERSTGGDR